MKQTILASIFGAILLFAWGSVSWMLLPWHTDNLSSFKNESIMSAMVAQQAPDAGVYMLSPKASNNENTGKLSSLQKTIDQAIYKDKQKPHVFSVVYFGPKADINLTMLAWFFTHLLSAGLVAYLLSKTRNLGFFGRVGFVMGVGLAAGTMTYLPELVWWHFPLKYTLINITDLLIGWYFAGLAMAAIIRPGK